ncbi:hypothetical protein [Thiohalorhabdus sp.]|uniref:hypothetical protein n=1 Tax=Thiohalorhabdus sp. TaxID=3094134 RepID=UPI002FC3BD14
MPSSASNPTSQAADRRLAVWAEALYLINLLPAPVIGFLALLWLYTTRRRDASPLAACHLKQTLFVSIWAGVLIGAVAALIVWIGGFAEPATWVVLILYVTCIHSAFILFGVIGLTKAMAAQPYRYPLIGPHCEAA